MSKIEVNTNESRENSILFVSDYPDDTEAEDIKNFFKDYTLISCQFVK
jgi:RNA recognition motif-containing protein